VRVRRAATAGRRTFWGWGGAQPNGRTGPIVATLSASPAVTGSRGRRMSS
jgi:hypothetical protein